jgi:hypothetical protein
MFRFVSLFHEDFDILLNNRFAEEAEAPSSRKKKQLNETELALRREETARKRKNLSEKKLEDEKVRLHSLIYI